MNQSYPLDWPVGYKRTTSPVRSKFGPITLDKAVKNLVDEVQRLIYGRAIYERSSTSVIISSNIPLRADGFPRADYSRRSVGDTGVAVYFKMHGQHQVLCCDAFDSVEQNIQALYKSIEAMRAIERYGVSDFIDRAFVGFKALQPAERQWWQVLEVTLPTTSEVVKHAFWSLSKIHHPDAGGDNDKWLELQKAYEQAVDELKKQGR